MVALVCMFSQFPALCELPFKVRIALVSFYAHIALVTLCAHGHFPTLIFTLPRVCHISSVQRSSG